MTCFSYFILKVYYQTRKPEQYTEILQRYLAACKGLMNFQDGNPEHYISLANACCKLADSLHGKEYAFIVLRRDLKLYKPTLKNLVAGGIGMTYIALKNFF